jgi:hypothetical protein
MYFATFNTPSFCSGPQHIGCCILILLFHSGMSDFFDGPHGLIFTLKQAGMIASLS